MSEGKLTQSNVKTLLIIDENESFIEAIEDSFRRHASEPVTILRETSVEGALEYLMKKKVVDIILTSFTFTNSPSNGLDLCLALNERQVQVPIILLTDVQDAQLAVDAMKLGVEDVFLKSTIDFQAFPRTVLAVLEHVRLRKSKAAVEKRIAMAESRTQAIRELVVTVCHEFNNPLAAVKISFDLLQRILKGEEEKALLQEFEKYYTRIEREIREFRDMNFDMITNGKFDTAE
ncbi:MAG: response regulator [Bacteroidetes bacterium]|nr:response regulator [Bacteroidota bacterium]